ncbi:MAG: hypothetical protein ABS46_09890 [Cytophagaceae bacterium SCN 52-12]|nr:MAG: hypothetical protein ABS46_09890 [Cytophagaceae bacterium SCN 52-12]
MQAAQNDLIIWKQMISGDEKSLGKLMHLYYTALLGYGYKFVKNDDFLKDCIQDLFIDIWNKRARLAIPDSIKAYLFVSLKRRIERNISREPYTEELADRLFPHVEFSPEWWLIREESVALKTRNMADLLNSLPKRQREVVYLKYYEEMSREEISMVLSITPQTVSNLLQLAYAYLRKHWKTSAIGLLLLLLS